MDDCELVATEVTTAASMTSGGGVDLDHSVATRSPSVKEELKMTVDAESNTVNSG